MIPDVHVIANPNSAGGRGARTLRPLRGALERRGLSYALECTQAPGHARELARRAVAEGAQRILVVGGDGTLHEVVNGLAAADSESTCVAVCPVGTGNDFFRMVDASSDLDAVAQVLAEGRERAFDLGLVRWEGGEEYFVNLLGVGVDVELLKKRPRFRRLPGLLQYLAALLAAMGTFRHRHVRVTLESDGGARVDLEARVLLAAVTVGPAVGGGIRVSPGARPDDGLLDLFLVEELGLFGVLRHLPRVLRGTHASVPQIHMHTLRRARIESGDGEPIHFELDGELMQESSPWLDIQVVPGRLRVLESPRDTAIPSGSRAPA